MRRRGLHHVGRLRLRAAAILRKNFQDLDVEPEDIIYVTGGARQCDYYRWELFTRMKSGLVQVYHSWETLTDFVKNASRRGCHANEDNEIYSNPIG